APACSRSEMRTNTSSEEEAAARAVRSASRDLQEDDGGEGRHCKHQYQPLQVVAVEPPGEMQDQKDDRKDAENVESHSLAPLSIPPDAQNKPTRYKTTAF